MKWLDRLIVFIITGLVFTYMFEKGLEVTAKKEIVLTEFWFHDTNIKYGVVE